MGRREEGLRTSRAWGVGMRVCDPQGFGCGGEGLRTSWLAIASSHASLICSDHQLQYRCQLTSVHLTLPSKQLRPSGRGGAARSVFCCPTTSATAAHAMQCATSCTPCRPMIREISRWIRTPPPKARGTLRLKI